MKNALEQRELYIGKKRVKNIVTEILLKLILDNCILPGKSILGNENRQHFCLSFPPLTFELFSDFRRYQNSSFFSKEAFKMNPTLSKDSEGAVSFTSYFVQKLVSQELDADFVSLMTTLQEIVKTVSQRVKNTVVDSEEDVEGLRSATNQLFISKLSESRTCCLLVSELMDNMVEVETEKQGGFVVLFNPLDGARNLLSQGAVGSVFGIYRKKSEPKYATKLSDVLQPGTEMVASGYAVYGPSTTLVTTTGDGVQQFTLNHSMCKQRTIHHMID